MSRMFGFMANEPDRLRCALFPARGRLSTSTYPNGWGIGFYQGGEVLLTRRPKPVGEQVEVYDQVRDLRSDALIGHVRTEPPTSDDTPPAGFQALSNPFRYRQWLFAHNGSLPDMPAIKGEMVDSIPDFLRRNLRGVTASEHLFHLLLAFLHDAGRLDDKAVSPRAVRDCVRAMTDFVDSMVARAGGTAPADLSLVVTNGRVMVALRRGRPMVVRRQEGLVDCAVCREPAQDLAREPKRINHDLLRSVLVISEPARPEAAKNGDAAAEGFVEVPDGAAVEISHELTYEVTT